MRLLGCVVLIFLAAPAYAGQALSRVPFGQTSSGGGNVGVPSAVSKADVANAIKTATKLLPYIFNEVSFDSICYVDIIGDGGNPVADVVTYNKLFGDTPAQMPIQKTLKSMKIVTQDVGACVSPLGAEDGAAYEDGSICLSLGRIAKKLNSDNLFPAVAALMAREASHLVGFSETEADKLQARVQILDPSLAIRHTRDLASEYLSLADRFLYELDIAKFELSRPNPNICAAISSLKYKIPHILSASSIRGAAALSYQQARYFNGSLGFKWNIMNAQTCGSSQDIMFINRLFRTQKTQSVQEAYAATAARNDDVLADVRSIPMTDIFVSYHTPDDAAAVLKEIAEMRDLTLRFVKSLDLATP